MVTRIFAMSVQAHNDIIYMDSAKKHRTLPDSGTAVSLQYVKSLNIMGDDVGDSQE